MSKRKIINPKNYIEKMDVSGESYIAGRDIHRYGDSSGMSVQDFQSLLTQITTELKTVNLSKKEKDFVQSNIELVKAQAQEKEPDKNLIVGPLTTVFNLIIKAAGAATAAQTIGKLLQDAIAFAQKMF